jgi:hypothetical protein
MSLATHAFAATPMGGVILGFNPSRFMEAPGPCFSAVVQRTWREDGTIDSARAVLNLLPKTERARILGEYTAMGGGGAARLANDADLFLPFLAQRLPDPSHALTLCRMAMALNRAREAAESFVAPSEDDLRPGGPVRRGRDARMVRFHADPEALIAALAGGSPPPLERSGPVILIAPGLPRFWRVASQAEAALWYRLPASDAPLSLCRRLITEGAVIAGQGSTGW